MIRLSIITAALALLAGPALADPCEAPLPKRGEVFSGRVAYVGDGDILCVSSPAGLIEIRIADFYAPELHGPGGEQAKRALTRIAKGRNIICVAGRRSYDRVVASCTLNGRDLGSLMRSAGVAEGGRGFGTYSKGAHAR